ncbi:Uncharacterized protein HZ326_8946 [Fusarium oxysporum f. sp. albedinis]|nr:Uncharacterized protein HZ326_8946 [Fusarium oxysporum f. sp. albedinis]
MPICFVLWGYLVSQTSTHSALCSIIPNVYATQRQPPMTDVSGVDLGRPGLQVGLGVLYTCLLAEGEASKGAHGSQLAPTTTDSSAILQHITPYLRTCSH